MSSLYSKNYIFSINPEDIKPIFTGEINYIPDPNNIEERKKYITIQHYLIKELEEKGKTPIINKLLKKYINDFLKYPHLFIDSPLIRDNFVNRYLPKDIRNKIIDFRRKYLDRNQNNEIYIKLINNQDLSETQKNRLYSYLIHQMKIGNELLENEYSECAMRILNSNKPIKDLNNTELKFYCTYVAKLVGKDFNIFPDVHITKAPPNNGGSEIHNIIYINKYSLYKPTIHDITQVVCHEARHAKQEIEVKTSKSKLSFEMASHMLLKKYLNTKDYDMYKVNYRYCDIEIDAERSGFFNAAVILARLNRPDLSFIQCEKEAKYLKKRNYYECMINKDGKRMSSDQFIVENLNNIIKKHPEELKRYKVLENFYKPNGSSKPFINMLTEKADQSFANRSIFDSFINYGIAKGELEKIKLKKITKEEKTKVFRSLSQIFNSRANVVKTYMFDTEYEKEEQNQMKITTLYQIKILDNIISYIDENIDIVLSLKEEDKINNKSFIYDFIRRFKDFNLKYTANVVLKNDKLIQERIDNLINKCQKITKKYDEQYIIDRIDDLSEEELNTIILTPERNRMPFKEYLFHDLLPKMNGNNTIPINGANSPINDIIKHYKKEVRKKKNIKNQKK